MIGDFNFSEDGPKDILTFEIMVEGKAIPQTVLVFSIDIWNEVNRIPRAKIVILDGDPTLENFNVSEQEWFAPDNKIEILAGYHSKNKLVFSGIINGQSLKVRNHGGNSLTIDCSDKTVEMTKAPRSRHFYNLKESEIFEKIISDYDGISSDIESTNYQYDELLQYQSTDWDFIVSRTEVNNMFCLIDSGKIKIQKPDFSSGTVHEIIFGRNLLELDATLDTSKQASSVKGSYWDYSKSEMTHLDGETSSPKTPGINAATSSSAGFENNNWLLQNSGKIPVELLQTWTNAKLLKIEMSKNRGRARIEGAVVSPGEIISLSGLGERFNGKAYVSGVKHSIGDGEWETDLQYGLSPEWFSDQHQISSRPAAGMLPSVSGLQIGLVLQIEDDPSGDERILVQFPVIGEEEQGIWARLATIGAGEDRGLVFRPEINDEVIVGFVGDDPNQPIILGSMHSSFRPSSIISEDENNLKGLTTRSGIKLMIDEDKIAFNVEMPSGRKITIDEDAGQILLEDGDGNSFNMDSAGISIESAGDLKINASGKIEINAGSELKAEAGAGLTASGNSGVEISSSAATIIKGSIVQIN